MHAINKRLFPALTSALVFLGFATAGISDTRPLRVAVASNFLTTARDLADLYTSETSEEVVLINGSSGTLFAQISNGAPYDLFLSADFERPQALFDAGLGQNPVAYAVGELVLLERGQAGSSLYHSLNETLSGTRTAVADPDLAPYGLAAMNVYDALGIATGARELVYGANVSAAAGLFASGNVDQALISRSLTQELRGLIAEGDDYTVTALDGHEVHVEQFATIVSQDHRAVDFLDLILSGASAEILAAHGYQSPGEATP